MPSFWDIRAKDRLVIDFDEVERGARVRDRRLCDPARDVHALRAAGGDGRRADAVLGSGRGDGAPDEVASAAGAKHRTLGAAKPQIFEVRRRRGTMSELSEAGGRFCRRCATPSCRACPTIRTRPGYGREAPPTWAPTRASSRCSGRCRTSSATGMIELIDALDQQGITRVSQRSRRADPAQRRPVRPRGGRRRVDPRRADAVHHLRRPGSEHGSEPELGGVRLPRPDRCGTQQAEDDRADRARRRRADARGRRVHRRLRCRRRRDRRDARAARAEGVRRWRRPATTTSPTSTSSSCRPTRRCTGAAARTRRRTST